MTFLLETSKNDPLGWITYLDDWIIQSENCTIALQFPRFGSSFGSAIRKIAERAKEVLEKTGWKFFKLLFCFTVVIFGVYVHWIKLFVFDLEMEDFYFKNGAQSDVIV